MNLFEFLSTFSLFLIPGFLFQLIFSYLRGQKLEKFSEYVVLLIIESTASCLIGNLFLWVLNQILKNQFSLMNIPQIISGNTVTFTGAGLVASIISAVILAITMVWMDSNRILFMTANRIGITNKSDNCDVWNYLFDEQSWIVLRDYVSGNVYYGAVEQYSDTGEIRELLLRDVSVFSSNDGDYHMEKVYLARAPRDFSVEIDHYAEKENTNGDKKEAGIWQ